MRTRLPVRLTLLAALTLAVLLPISARAGTAPATGMGGTFADSSGNTGPVGGVFFLESFGQQDGQLVATGSLFYSFCFPGVDPKNCLASFSQTVTLPVPTIEASCDQASFSLGPLELVSPVGLDGFTLDFDQSLLVVPATSTGTRGMLCGLGKRLAGGAGGGNLVPFLNRLIDP